MKLKTVEDRCPEVPNEDASNASKREYLNSIAGQIVNKYILNTTQNKILADRILEEQTGDQVADADNSNERDDMLS